MKAVKPLTLGLIIGNRGFFPGHICEEGRAQIINVLEELNISVITLGPEDTQYGAIESLDEAKKLADLFKKNRDKIDGILVTLPNFGDERAIANVIRMSELNVPVLVHAFPDDLNLMDLASRRDAFCGKISVCNNLHQYGIKFTLTSEHTQEPDSDAFREDIQKFGSICRIVKGLKGARVGVIGARTAAFNTVRFSEKLFEHSGISVETIDLSEVIGKAAKLSDQDPGVVNKIKEIENYATLPEVRRDSLMRMAKLGVVIDTWMEENDLVASAIQCWTSMQEIFGIVPCTLMSMMSNDLIPSACETDISGAVSMYILTLATGKPSAIVDWNNNFGGDPNKGMFFHCSNLPCDVFQSSDEEEGTAITMGHHDILSNSFGVKDTFGTLAGKIKTGPFTFLRVSTADLEGKIHAYVGEGVMRDENIDTFGGFGVFEISGLQDLLHFICNNGFEHHVSINLSEVAEPIHEALSKYMEWDVLIH